VAFERKMVWRSDVICGILSPILATTDFDASKLPPSPLPGRCNGDIDKHIHISDTADALHRPAYTLGPCTQAHDPSQVFFLYSLTSLCLLRLPPRQVRTDNRILIAARYALIHSTHTYSLITTLTQCISTHQLPLVTLNGR
jgi:hypothetical protein